MEIIGKGAEAVVFKEGENIVKERISKSYRHPEIDKKLRKIPTRREGKLLNMASEVVNVPYVLELDDKNMKIVMDHIDGDAVKSIFDSLNDDERKKLCLKIGEDLGKLHAINVIHGDLTTSNMILRNKDLFFIDFGLGFVSDKVEDKAVDLRLLRQAFESKHYNHFEDVFDFVLEGYAKWEGSEEVFSRLDKVDSRGRYKSKSKQ